MQAAVRFLAQEAARGISHAVVVAAAGWSCPIAPPCTACSDCICTPSLTCPDGQKGVPTPAPLPAASTSSLGWAFAAFLAGLIVGYILGRPRTPEPVVGTPVVQPPLEDFAALEDIQAEGARQAALFRRTGH